MYKPNLYRIGGNTNNSHFLATLVKQCEHNPRNTPRTQMQSVLTTTTTLKKYKNKWIIYLLLAIV